MRYDAPYRWVSTARYLEAEGRGKAVPTDVPEEFFVSTLGSQDAEVVARALTPGTSSKTFEGPQQENNTRPRARTGTTRLPDGQRYYAVVSTERYLERDIGCALGRLLICRSPLG